MSDSMKPMLLRAAISAIALIPMASFADARGGGESTTTDFIITAAVDEVTDIWPTLLTELLNLSSTSNIIVTACSDLDNPGGSTANTYNFVNSLDDDSPGLNTSGERTVDDLYDDPNKDDPDSVEVCTTRFFANVPAGDHTIRWQGSKASTSMANVTVKDSSMSIGSFSGSQL